MASTEITKFAHLQIPLEDVKKATNNFHNDNFIGRGGFGPIYKGLLLRSSGELIKISAVWLDRKHGERGVEFWTEISVLSDLKHTNIVTLIGFCDEKGEKIIITTYEANGSLERHLSDPNLTWTQRLKICVGVARAMSYLRYDEGRGYGVIHLNINSSTILLDENLEAKLSGFKVSIIQSSKRMGHVVLSEPIGTYGYFDPAIIKTRGVTYKSDIYSFGVVLFEILCGRRAFIKDNANKYLARLAKRHYENETMQDIIHPDLWKQMSPHTLLNYSKLAYFCLNENRGHRPDTDNIIEVLEKELKLQLQSENLGKNLEHLRIRLDDIKLATHNFSETYKLDYTRKGYSLYRAEVDHFDKEKPSSAKGKSRGELAQSKNTVVIKRFLPTDGMQEELFTADFERLTSTVKHDNIVTLIGFCVECYEMILIIENISNEQLYSYLENYKDMITSSEKKEVTYLRFEMKDEKMIIRKNDNSEKKEVTNFNFNWGDKIELPYGGIFFSSEEERALDVASFGDLLLEMVCTMLDTYGERGMQTMARQGTLGDVIDLRIKVEISGNIILLHEGHTKECLHTFAEIVSQCVAKSDEDEDEPAPMKVLLKELEKALMLFQASQEERTDQPNKDRVADDGHQFTHEIPVEVITESSNTNRVVNKLEELLARDIHGNNLEHLRFSVTDIQLATDNFSETYRFAVCDGCNLYRAALDHFDPSSVQGKNQGEHPKGRNTVVIKRYPNGEDQVEEFFTEIEVLKSVKHRNIVTLVGICVEGSEKILVMENVSNGYLNDYLGNIYFDKRHVLTWEKRLKICIDVAQALNYLHHEMEDQKVIINRDISSCGIALDENLGAKIVHFWFSFLLPPNKSGDLYDDRIHINPKGRPSYIDPHYEKFKWLRRESDVYSFGVVLFEILCGRTVNDPIYSFDFAPLVRRSFSMGTIEDMIDPIIKEENNGNMFVLHTGPTKQSLDTFIEIAHQCLVEDQNSRPTMEVVLKELQKALFLQKKKEHSRIPLEDIKVATQNFKTGIGRGGFGKVFRGNLQDGNVIVAKLLDTNSGQGKKEFLTELRILLEYKHENVIGLVGYCDEEDEKIIVYEHASKGDLESYLNDGSLTWVKRLNICIDVASALDFLHGGVGKHAKVIHRDIKTANILLNDDWKAKLGDFGLSFISPLIQETDHVIDEACGTRGYLDPLYMKYGFLTIESDIYSFGIVLFEILCGTSTYAVQRAKGHYLQDFIKKIFDDGKHNEVVFEKISEQIMPKSLTIFQKIAYQCLHPEREKRPATKEVLTQLRSSLAFQDMEPAITKLTHLKISLEDIVKATNNFHHDNVIRQRHGGFVAAYKGQLMWSGRLLKIVARRFDCKKGEGYLKFWTEILMLTSHKHTNLVSVIGFVDEKDEKIIVHEANGSLRQYLNNSNLTWTQRLRICVGVARALSYLHHDEGRGYALIHRIINSDTILLDENSEVKVSSFEHSIKQFYEDQVHICEPIHVMGYVDPKIQKIGGVTQDSDIYSFGVVLFEILSGKEAYDVNCPDGYMVEGYQYVSYQWFNIDYEDRKFLAKLAKYHYENGTLKSIIHPDIRNQILSPQSLVTYSKLAYSCFEERAHLPNMDYIVEELQKTLEIQLRFEHIISSIEHLRIPLGDIKLATGEFSQVQKIQFRGCWALYRGLPVYSGEPPSFLKGTNVGQLRDVIIKRIRPDYAEKEEEVFYKEIEKLTSVKHPNIVTLLGFCVEGPEMILVIEGAYNNYLDGYFGIRYRSPYDFILESSPYELTWEERLKICFDVAHALNYLHYDAEDKKIIISGSIRSSNIGLDENHRAKIYDFRYSIFLPPNQEDEALCDNEIVDDMIYYIDPVYKSTGKLKRESDVYSFGVVLFEILCGKLAYSQIYKEGSDKGLAHVARRNFCTGTIEEMIDPTIKEANKDSLQTCIEIAYQCVAETQDQRPTMEVVVKELKKALYFQLNSDQTDGSADSVYCWPCGFWKVNTTTFSGWLLRLLGQRS